MLVVVLIKAQDSLFLNNNNTELVKIIEILPGTTKYVFYQMNDGPQITINNNDIKKIVFKNGTTKTFVIHNYYNDTIQNAALLNKKSNDCTLFNISGDSCGNKKLYENAINIRAIRNADSNYINKTPSIVTGLVSWVCIPCGLITAISVNSSPPNSINLNVSNFDYFKNNIYKYAYIKEAHKIKRSNVWSSFAVGSIASIISIFFAGAFLVSKH